MNELFVKESIDINSPVSKVWDVLTKAELTRHWIGNFGLTGGEIVSEWKMGSPVLWKGADGKTIVEGSVTAVDPGKLLRFTVFDVRSERPPVTEKDGITYTLLSQNAHTVLSVTQGDFSAMPEGEKYYQASVEVWKKVLPEIKALAER